MLHFICVRVRPNVCSEEVEVQCGWCSGAGYCGCGVLGDGGRDVKAVKAVVVEGVGVVDSSVI